MPLTDIDPVWPQRLDTIDSPVDSIFLPEADSDNLDQDQEWCEVSINGKRHRIRFHDYHKIFEIPGLYELIFYDALGCTSPSRIAHLLDDIIQDFGDDVDGLRVLDVGAGNGMVGDELKRRGAERVVGVDIIDQAMNAQKRDRPEVYEDYVVADLTDLPEQDEEKLRKHRFNCLSTVAALGYGDIPPQAFIKALDLVETPAWLAFNIKESFLHEQDDSGFARLVRKLARDQVIRIEGYRRYQHRRSVDGKPLYYVAMVARKLEDIHDDLLGP